MTMTTDRYPFIYINENNIVLQDGQIFLPKETLLTHPLTTYGYVSTCTDHIDDTNIQTDTYPVQSMSTTPVIET